MLWILLFIVAVPLIALGGFLGTVMAGMYSLCKALVLFSRVGAAVRKRAVPEPRPGPLAGYYLPQNPLLAERLADREFLTSLGVAWDRTAPADRDRRRGGARVR